MLQNKKVTIRPKSSMEVAEWLDGSIHILFQGKEVPYEEVNFQILQKVRMGRRIAEYISMNT